MATEWEELRQTLMTPNTVMFQRLANLRELMNSLEDSLNSVSTSSLSCSTCRGTVPRSGSRQRQACPACGTLYRSTTQNYGRNFNIELPHIDGEPRTRLGAFGHFMFNHFRNNNNNNNNSNNSNTSSRRGNQPNSSGSKSESDNNAVISSNNQRTETPTPSCLGMRRRSRPTNEPILALPDPEQKYRLGSGNSLPPITIRQGDGPRRNSTSAVPDRTSRSEERVPSSQGNREDAKKDSKPVYPKITVHRHEFMKRVKAAKEAKNYTEMKKFYFQTFESYQNICATFKKDPTLNGAKLEETGLNMELVHTVHDSLRELPSLVHKHFLKGVINSLLEERPHLFSKDRLRALFILIQSPMFLSQSSYNVLAHVIRTITDLPNVDHQILVSWFKTMEVSRFRLVVSFITQFITVRQFPPPDRSLPPLSSSKWWIPSATKVLAILYASNLAARPPLVSYIEFYNHALDHMDLMAEYRRWQMLDRPDTFSYCQYPFVLSIVAKRFILTKDAEQQMILIARRSLVERVAQHQPPQIDIFFLNININRNNLVEDSLREIGSRKSDLKKKLRVTFEGEPGLDMGGLTKEWFLLLIKKIFMPENQMFVYHPSRRLYWFAMGGEGSLKEYNLIGVLMGLAVYNSIILDVKFPSICYRKLLSPPVVPSNDVFPVGVAKEPSIDDLAEIMPEVAHSLKELLKYEGDVEEDMCLTFQVSMEEFEGCHTFDLKENGEEIPVNNENRNEFVRLYLDWILNTAIYEQFRAFYLGFHSVTASNALIMLRPEEVEMLVCGSPTLDLNELRKVTEYDGYTQDHPTIRWFWQLMNEMPLEQQKQFLLFTTGSDRIPVGGMGEMTFKISCWLGKTHMLPQAHTCFNQLVLPPYEDKESLKQKLLIAINNAEGFGLE